MCRGCVGFSIIIPAGPAVLCVGNGVFPQETPVSLSMADLFWAGFCALVGCGAWGFNAVECGKQRGTRTGYFNGIEAIQRGLSAQFHRTSLVHGKAVGTMAGICSCSVLQPNRGYCVQTTLKLLWKRGRKESVPQQKRLQLSRQAPALLGDTAGH